MRTNVVGDLYALPDHAFGLKSIIWWGLMGFMMIESMGFVLALGAWVYIRGLNPSWPPPPDAVPGLIPGIVVTVLFLLSEVVNRWLAAQAKKKEDDHAVRLGVTAMLVLGLAIVVARMFEFPQLHTRWDVNAYGSVVWLLMFLHTLHLITDWIDTVVLGAWLYTHEIEPSQHSEVYDNCGYWTFVVVSWLPIWFVVYIAPRVM